MSTSEREYYIAAYRLDYQARYLIWYRTLNSIGDQDGVILDSAHRIITFASVTDIRAFAAGKSIDIADEEPSIHNFDCVVRWLSLNGKRTRRLRASGVNCHEFLSCWNLLDDIKRSLTNITATWLPRKELHVYMRLFWGSNLPAVTPPGEHFTPYWLDWETRLMRRVFRERIALLRAHTSAVPWVS